MKARLGILLPMLVAYASTATAGGQHELPPITVVGKPAHVPAANPLPPRPESHAWGWSNAVGRHLGFDPQVAEATLRQNDDCGGNPGERFSGNKVEPELDFASSGGLSLQ